MVGWVLGKLFFFFGVFLFCEEKEWEGVAEVCDLGPIWRIRGLGPSMSADTRF